MPPFHFQVTGDEGLAAVEPLWNKLRAYHAQLEWRFANEMEGVGFECRKQQLLAKASGDRLRVELVGTTAETAEVGFCISSIAADNRGEIDSVFVDEAYRGRGIGSQLIRSALDWLDREGARPKCIAVASANRAAMVLYGRFGFLPRTFMLQQPRS
jgi:GNAT superfamily N-acetyltransferase